MEDIEEGQLPSSGEEEDTTYNPLPRPELPQMSVRPRSGGNSRNSVEEVHRDDDNVDENSVPGLFNSDDSDDSDSDMESKKPKRKMKRTMRMSEDGGNKSMDTDNGGGALFQKMASRFQAERRSSRGEASASGGKRNNVWGSILQEESLTSEMTGIGVGRTLKDLESDRGAETYDFFLVAEAREKEKTEAAGRVKSDLDSQLTNYWTEDKVEDRRRSEAIRAGKKRSVKDRLGPVGDRSSPDDLDDMSIPPPGVPRMIPDLNQTVLDSLQNEMQDDSSDETEDNKITVLGDELASKLSEPKTELMIGVIEIVGPEVAIELFAKTQVIESQGGMMIKNGARRRTPGGVFFQILRELATDENETRVDNKQIRLFFAQSNRDYQDSRRSKSRQKHRKGSRGGGDFKSELEAFKKLNKTKNTKATSTKENNEELGEEELKPLPDILTCISQRMARSSPDEDNSTPEAFVEPDAPPNSVERTVNAYDDDFLNTECETEDIELF
jgi:phosphorylated adapter RNA export protein